MALEENVLPPEREAYIDWLCTAPGERKPASKEAYATLHGVNVTTLRRWEKNGVFKREWERRVDNIQGSPERTQRLLDALYEKAVAGDTKAAQLYLQATNRMTPPTQKVEIETKPTELTDAQLEELIALKAAGERDARLRVV